MSITVQVTAKVTPAMVYAAIRQRFAAQLVAFYGAPAESLTHAQIAAWASRVPAGGALIDQLRAATQ